MNTEATPANVGCNDGLGGFDAWWRWHFAEAASQDASFEEAEICARLVWQAARAHTREVCAQECERVAERHRTSGRYVSVVADHSVRAGGQVDGAEECARAIRGA